MIKKTPMQKEILGHVRNSWEFMCVCVYMHEREKRTRQANRSIKTEIGLQFISFLSIYLDGKEDSLTH